MAELKIISMDELPSRKWNGCGIPISHTGN